MLDLLQPATPASPPSTPAPVEAPSRARRTRAIRAVRPSLIDLRFKGDAMVLGQEDGRAGLFLGQYRLLQVAVGPFDLPSLNSAWLQLRLGEARRQYLQTCA